MRLFVLIFLAGCSYERELAKVEPCATICERMLQTNWLLVDRNGRQCFARPIDKYDGRICQFTIPTDTEVLKALAEKATAVLGAPCPKEISK